MSHFPVLYVIYMYNMTTEDFYHTIIPLRDVLKRYAMRLTADADDADDLVQEPMLRLWDMRSRLDAADPLRAFAVTVLRNRFYDKVRHDSHRRQFGRDGDVAVEDNRAELRSEVELIQAIIDRLPPLQQRLFRMKEIEGYTAEEIMRITGTTADNLRRNLSRARMKIRQEFINMTQQGGNTR